jgi:hypothetical protein
MTWFGWLLIAWWFLTALLSVATIGKPRPPPKGEIVAVSLCIQVILVVGVLAVGTGNLGS